MPLRFFLFFCIVAVCHGLFAQPAGNEEKGGKPPYNQRFYGEASPVVLAAAAAIASSLDDNCLAAQVLLTGIDGKASLSPAMKSLLEKHPAGGVMLFRYNLETTKDEVKNFLSETVNAVTAGAGIPPFMAVDHEGGLVHRFGPGVEKLPSAYSFWELAQKQGRDPALRLAEAQYLRSANEIRELGITMVLGPVAEILNDDNRLFLETRSYGGDPGFTLAAASAYVKSMDAAGIACVVKHFPGNTASDPHSGVSTLQADKAALDDMVKPFAALINGLSPPALMLSHVMVPAIDSRRNASISGPVINGWIRGELGFSGIILADDFSMGAVAAAGLSPSSAAVEALNSGVDMIMAWPKNIGEMHSAILRALLDGRLGRKRLLEAASRIIAEKIRYGLVESQ